MKTGIVWFRQDLRLADNPALRAALNRCKHVVPVYIHETESGERPLGAASRWWLHHSLSALDRALRDRGSRLILRGGQTQSVIAELTGECEAEAIFWNRRYTPAGVRRDRTIKQQLRCEGLNTASFNASLLHEPWEILKSDDSPYRVFTPFWKACLSKGIDRQPIPAPHQLQPSTRWPKSLAIGEFKLLPAIPWDAGLYKAWQPGEAGAQERLTRFLDSAVRHYKAGRDIPGKPYTSKLSPHLHFGEISPGQIVAAVQARTFEDTRSGVHQGTESFVRELGWREFAYHLLYHFPHTTEQPLDERFAQFPWRQDYQQDQRAWQQGQTGVPIVDAGMRELWATGWMHNRLRMIVASLLVKNLLIPWQEGERWFWDTLVDADLANNPLGWQWVAGCGADAAPYFRIFNPVLQGEKFDAAGAYVRRWVPELAPLPDKYLHKPWEAAPELLAPLDVVLGKTYPKPIVDLRTSRERALKAFERVKTT